MATFSFSAVAAVVRQRHCPHPSEWPFTVQQAAAASAEDGTTALHVATICSNIDAALALAACSSHINAIDDDGNTALMYAITRCDAAFTTALLEAAGGFEAARAGRINPFIANRKGRRAIDMLLQRRWLPAIAVCMGIDVAASGDWMDELLCPLCLTEVADVRLSCGHTACLGCANSHADHRIVTARDTQLSLACWASGCGALLGEQIDTLLLVAPATRAQLERNTLEAALACMGDFVWCPRCEGGGWAPPAHPTLSAAQTKHSAEATEGTGAAAPEGAGAEAPGEAIPGAGTDSSASACTSLHCTECLHSFCALCRAPGHDGVSCDAYRGSDTALCDSWKESNSKPCPKCRAPTVRDGGCSHMTCQACRFQWCWLCNGKYQGKYTFGAVCPCPGREAIDLVAVAATHAAAVAARHARTAENLMATMATVVATQASSELLGPVPSAGAAAPSAAKVLLPPPASTGAGMPAADLPPPSLVRAGSH